MSNIFPPKLMPKLDPLPKINNLHPMDYVSYSVPYYPPMKTPKLQELQNETVTYPEFRNQDEVIKVIYPAKQAIGATPIYKEIRIVPSIRKPKKIKKIKVPRCKDNQLYIIILYIILIILIYYVLQIILNF
jgi:hypothetical protein